LNRSRSRFLIALSILAAATLAGGTLGSRLLAVPEREQPNLDEYADILTTLSEWAPESVPPEKFVYASIHGMLSRLDPHTTFLEPDDYAAMREKQQGSFFGLGIQIQKRMGRITVIAPMEGTPAFKQGVRATSSRTSRTRSSRRTSRRTTSCGSCAGPRGRRSRSRCAGPASTSRSG